MKTAAKIAKIVGPPGCGKTTRLMALIQKACERYDPAAIGAVSYTNAAVEEIKDRISQAAGVSKEAARNTRTIHSHCFNLLELKSDNVADTSKRIKEWNEWHPKWAISTGKDDDDDPFENDPALRDNQKCFALMNVLRNRMIPVNQWNDPETEFLYHDWTEWMEMNGYIDYTGMLEKTLKEHLIPDIDILFVDEAQDATPLQIAILQMWAEKAVSTLFVGDSDQAIFRWAGAVPEAFINLQHEHYTTLSQSYRVPKAIHRYATKIIRQALNREDVPYSPTDEEGEIIGGVPEPDLSLDGTHMIIARCGYQLTRWRRWLAGHHIVWHNPYRPAAKQWNPTNTKQWKAAKTYIQLKNGEEIKGDDVRRMIQELPVNGNLVNGVKTAAHDYHLPERVDFFDLVVSKLFTNEFLEFKRPVQEVFRLKGMAHELIPGMSENDIVRQPRVVLGTIHSVKGGEADHVWVDTGTSTQCARAMMNDTEAYWDEVRVAYVAVTRARKTLGLIVPSGIPNVAFL